MLTIIIIFFSKTINKILQIKFKVYNIKNLYELEKMESIFFNEEINEEIIKTNKDIKDEI